MAGVFDLELESSNFDQEEVSDEDPIDIGEDQVQVSLIQLTTVSTHQLKIAFQLSMPT